MAREITASFNFAVRKGSLRWRGEPSAWQATMEGKKGPSPGAITVTPDGTDVDFSELDNPTWCWIANDSTSDFITVGIWDPDSLRFFPLLEVGPGESYPMKLSRYLQAEFSSTGTGTIQNNNTLRIYSNLDDCDVRVEAFNK